jgi:hypothetical protein
LPSEECTSTHYEKSKSFTQSCWNASRGAASVQRTPGELGVRLPNGFRSHRPTLIAVSWEAMTPRAILSHAAYSKASVLREGHYEDWPALLSVISSIHRSGGRRSHLRQTHGHAGDAAYDFSLPWVN